MRVHLIDGLPIVDAKRPMRLEVTKRIVDKADPKKPASCALAQACKAKEGVAEVRIHLTRAYVRLDGSRQWTKYLVTQRLRQEIVVFDRGGKFAPGEYHLLAVQPSKRIGADKRKRPGKKLRTGKTRPYHHAYDVRVGPAS